MTAAGAVSAITPELADGLRALLGDRVAFGEPLARHVSMGVGGPADAFCRPASRDELRKLAGMLSAGGVPLFALGGGTNLLPSDAGFRGAVVKLEGGFTEITFEGTSARAGSGATLGALVNGAARRGLGGLESCAGIPGTVGGALVGNAGAQGEAVGDCVATVDTLAGGTERVRSRAEIPFSYRHSGLGGDGELVLSAEFALIARAPGDIQGRMKGFLERRKLQPLGWNNAGCVFKNPGGKSAGALLDQAGLKGAREGGMEVSERHANFVNNSGGGTAAQALALMSRMRREVHARFGVVLEPEVRAIDETGRPVEWEALA